MLTGSLVLTVIGDPSPPKVLDTWLSGILRVSVDESELIPEIDKRASTEAESNVPATGGESEVKATAGSVVDCGSKPEEAAMSEATPLIREDGSPR